ncbi:MAG: recombinase family protein [Lachnospiraceae bacterium]|nr:recombinase family protein [Lachnospiraceae bacterium]
MERVGIYNRCSTEEESQMNALATQAFESREIAERKGWRIAEQYIESQTGTVAYKRGEYQRLLEDMEKDRFDIVMIKSIDRLTRSAKDWYFFLSRLTENRLKLYIYIEGKFYTPDDNLISGIKAILAEDFSRELSKKIKNAHKRRQEKRSGCNITCDMFGWNKVGKDSYEINEEEAEYYRTAFALAKEGKGFYTISNTLYELGARGRRGQKISEVQWRKMLYTPRAHGTMILNRKTYNFDMKRYEEVPEKEWITMENALPPIVSREYQEEVITVMKKRAVNCRNGINSCEKKYGGKYALTRKLKCAECGRYYYRTSYASGKGRKVVWKCATFLENGRAGGKAHGRGCDNINLSEEKLLACVGDALKNDYEPLCGEEQLLTDIMHIMGKALESQNGKRELKKLEKEHKKLLSRKDTLVEKLLSGVINDLDYEKYSADIADRCRMIESKISGIKQNHLQYNNYEARMEDIKTAILKENLIGKAETKTFLKQIYQIEVHKDGRLFISFELERECRKEVIYQGRC